jgi:hypothetical protein
MDTSSLITADGPNLHVLLRDALPPDWEELRREIEREIDDGAQQVTFAVSQRSCISPIDAGLLRLTDLLRTSGVSTVILS